MALRPSSRAYVEHRVVRRHELNHLGETTEEEARLWAEEDAARLEAMGSTYDPVKRRWSPIWLRINPTHGPQRNEARDALRFAVASAGGGYDVRAGLWRIDNPAHGAMHFVDEGWEKHYFEALPLYRHHGWRPSATWHLPRTST